MNKQAFIIEANSFHNLPISGDFSFYNSNKNLIIFCHGFKGFKDWGCWNLVSNYFCQRGFNFLKFNFSHNGTTVSNPSEITDFNAFRNNNYSIELQDIGRVINYVKSSKSILNHNNLYLIGHSRGGGIACLATQNHPEIILARDDSSVSMKKYIDLLSKSIKNDKKLKANFIMVKRYLDYKLSFLRLYILSLEDLEREINLVLN